VGCNVLGGTFEEVGTGVVGGSGVGGSGVGEELELGDADGLLVGTAVGLGVGGLVGRGSVANEYVSESRHGTPVGGSASPLAAVLNVFASQMLTVLVSVTFADSPAPSSVSEIKGSKSVVCPSRSFSATVRFIGPDPTFLNS
jgi:hypothetical protein